MTRAIIMAGGKGRRLLPFTTLIPKPLVPIGGKYSVLEIIITQLVKNGFNHITLAVSHFSHLIHSYFGDGSRFGVFIDYMHEESELSTIGPLSLIRDLPDNFLVMNGDILTNLCFRSFLDTHSKNSRVITVAAHSREVVVDYGVLEVSGSNNLIGFTEKPSLKYDVSMGVYAICSSALTRLPKGKKYGFDDLMLDSLRVGRAVSVIRHEGFWLDIGRVEDYDYANQEWDSISALLGLMK